jgi:hypothetical protein
MKVMPKDNKMYIAVPGKKRREALLFAANCAYLKHSD